MSAFKPPEVYMRSRGKEEGMPDHEYDGCEECAYVRGWDACAADDLIERDLLLAEIAILKDDCLTKDADNARLREALNSKRDWVTISEQKAEIARLREAIKAEEDRLRDQFTYIEGQTWASHTRELRVIADAMKIAREGK